MVSWNSDDIPKPPQGSFVHFAAKEASPHCLILGEDICSTSEDCSPSESYVRGAAFSHIDMSGAGLSPDQSQIKGEFIFDDNLFSHIRHAMIGGHPESSTLWQRLTEVAR